MTEDANDTKTRPVTIKKYANRRLYNTATSSYVTLEDLAVMIKDGVEFTVYDAKSGEDITHSVLTHIIVEQEGKGQNLLPVSFLRHLISFYGDSLESVVPKYLEQSMSSFADNQEKMRDYLQETLGTMSPFSSFEEAGKQNMAMFESAMKMFTPFGNAMTPPSSEKETQTPKAPKPEKYSSDLDNLRAQIDAMQQQLNKMAK